MVLAFVARIYNAVMRFPKRAITAWTPPPLWLVRFLTWPLRLVFEPVVSGLENVPKDTRKLLFVGNHTLYGIDMPLFYHELATKRGVWYRGLADHVHFLVPIWKHLLEFFGAVQGTASKCSELMRNGSVVLVYPGGAHEVLKAKNVPRYAMLWKDRAGFARLAIEHGYTIVPFSSVGMEDAFFTWFDFPVGWALRLIGDKREDTEIVLPIPIPYFRFQRCYFHFGNAIDTAEFEGDAKNEQFVQRVREQTREAVAKGIAMMRNKQAHDPLRIFSVRRTLKKFLNWLASLCARNSDVQFRAQADNSSNIFGNNNGSAAGNGRPRARSAALPVARPAHAAPIDEGGIEMSNLSPHLLRVRAAATRRSRDPESEGIELGRMTFPLPASVLNDDGSSSSGIGSDFSPSAVSPPSARSPRDELERELRPLSSALSSFSSFNNSNSSSANGDSKHVSGEPLNLHSNPASPATVYAAAAASAASADVSPSFALPAAAAAAAAAKSRAADSSPPVTAATATTTAASTAAVNAAAVSVDQQSESASGSPARLRAKVTQRQSEEPANLQAEPAVAATTAPVAAAASVDSASKATAKPDSGQAANRDKGSSAPKPAEPAAASNSVESTAKAAPVTAAKAAVADKAESASSDADAKETEGTTEDGTEDSAATATASKPASAAAAAPAAAAPKAGASSASKGRKGKGKGRNRR